MATSADRFVHRPNAIDRLGRTVVYTGELLRHPVYTRFLHWMVGIFFFLALLSGFGIYLPWIFRFFTPLFGGGATTRFLHPWFGLAFVFFFALQAINWLQVMRWTPDDSRWMKHIKQYVTRSDSVESPETGFFNAG
jgi:formate dehydrogenase subunit gamma